MTYTMSLQAGGSVIIKTQADSLEEAIDFFAKMKQLPREDFLKLFLVTEINK